MTHYTMTYLFSKKLGQNKELLTEKQRIPHDSQACLKKSHTESMCNILAEEFLSTLLYNVAPVH